jgi:replication-associated recombination protein RarA
MLIYPFGVNQSQKAAVENAFSSQISIIQGPPGTGKTQTILNIIANAVLQNKTIAVVSNNNSATLNVVEKMTFYAVSPRQQIQNFFFPYFQFPHDIILLTALLSA